MKSFTKHVVTCGLLAAIGMTPLAVLAESDFDSGAGALSAAARLNLRVTIPEFLFFRVGNTGATIDTITFAPAVIDVGDSTPVAGTGGDAAAGSGASVRLVSNAGQITITETNDTSNGLEGGAGDIALTEISVTSDDANLGTPTLSNAGGGTSTPVLNGGNVTNRSAVWTYAYNNTTIPEADNYDVEITYTATSL